jgi:hypothetical protein
MGTRHGNRRFPISFAIGAGFAILIKIFVDAIGSPTAFATAGIIVALFGFVFGVAFFTGLNLGMFLAIKDVGPGEGNPVSPSAGLCCILFSLGILVATAILA